jgi:D-galactarolactone cycloisomerase
VKITDVEVLNLHFDYPPGQGYRYAGGTVTSRTTSIVRIHTDTGEVGIGSAYSYPDLVRVIVEQHLRPHLLGADPCQVEQLWDKMYSLTRWYGRKGVGLSALGGIDIALWDLRGKAVGKPVYQLLGGTRGPGVPAYASGLFWTDDVGDLVEEAARHRDAGFRRVKTRLGRGYEYDLAAVHAIRQGLGQDGEILVDGSHRYTVADVEAFAVAARGLDLYWFEEPFAPEDIESYVEARGMMPWPLAAGENEFGVQGFRELFRLQAVDVAQPDACRTGGITESIRIAELAAECGVKIAPHTWSDAVALIANAHVVASIPHGLTVEVDRTGNPFIDELLSEPPSVTQGLLTLSERPGLGIELDPGVLTRLAMPAGRPLPDGNYSDLIFGAAQWHEEGPFLHRSREGADR